MKPLNEPERGPNTSATRSAHRRLFRCHVRHMIYGGQEWYRILSAGAPPPAGRALCPCKWDWGGHGDSGGNGNDVEARFHSRRNNADIWSNLPGGGVKDGDFVDKGAAGTPSPAVAVLDLYTTNVTYNGAVAPSMRDVNYSNGYLSQRGRLLTASDSSPFVDRPAERL